MSKINIKETPKHSTKHKQMTMIRALLIEDEEPARDLIKNYLNDYPDFELIAEYADGFSGLKGIHEHQPDIVFLDIQMPKLTGFELLELLENPPLIIFTTAYDEFAIKAFELNTADYLLKPFSKQRFAKAIRKSKELLQTPQNRKTEQLEKLVSTVHNAIETLERIVVKNGAKIHVIDVNDILYLQAEDDYVMIHTAKERFLKQNTLTYYEKHLSKNDFIRIHRSTIARIDQITMINNYAKESYMLSLKCGTKLKVSRSRIKELKERLSF